MTDQLYSAEEAARRLGLQVRTVRNYVRDGRLPGVRIGKQYRISSADLEAFTSAGGGQARYRQAPVTAQAPPVVEASSVVLFEDIDPAASARLELTLSAAGNSGVGGRKQPLRIEPIYDPERRRLRVVVVGSPSDTADVLRLIDVLTAGQS